MGSNGHRNKQLKTEIKILREQNKKLSKEIDYWKMMYKDLNNYLEKTYNDYS